MSDYPKDLATSGVDHAGRPVLADGAEADLSAADVSTGAKLSPEPTIPVAPATNLEYEVPVAEPGATEQVSAPPEIATPQVAIPETVVAQSETVAHLETHPGKALVDRPAETHIPEMTTTPAQPVEAHVPNTTVPPPGSVPSLADLNQSTSPIRRLLATIRGSSVPGHEAVAIDKEMTEGRGEPKPES